MSNLLIMLSQQELYIYLITFALFILQIISYWYLFKKAKVAGWKSIVPFYNDFTMYKLVWKPKRYFAYIILSIVSGLASYFKHCVFTSGIASIIVTVINLIVLLSCCYLQFIFCRKLAFAYGKSATYAVGLFFLFPIFILFLGFGNSRYLGNRSNQ